MLSKLKYKWVCLPCKETHCINEFCKPAYHTFDEDGPVRVCPRCESMDIKRFKIGRNSKIK